MKCSFSFTPCSTKDRAVPLNITVIRLTVMAFVYRCQATSPCTILELSIFNIVCLKINILNIQITCVSSFPHPSVLGMRCLCLGLLDVYQPKTPAFQRFSDHVFMHIILWLRSIFWLSRRSFRKKGLFNSGCSIFVYIHKSDIQNKLKHASFLFLLFSCYSQHFYFYSFHSCPWK